MQAVRGAHCIEDFLVPEQTTFPDTVMCSLRFSSSSQRTVVAVVSCGLVQDSVCHNSVLTGVLSVRVLCVRLSRGRVLARNTESADVDWARGPEFIFLQVIRVQMVLGPHS